MICSVWTREPASPNWVGRVRRAMTTSSSDALPARSPRPLIVTSTWRAPACTAASVLAVASPRSLWQWTLTVAASPTRSTTRPTSARELGRDRIADRIRDVDRGRTGLDDGAVDLEQEVGVGPRGVLRGELDLGVPPELLATVGHPAHRVGERLLAIDAQLVLEVDVAGGDEHGGGRSATLIASMARCGSPSRQRASAATAIPPFVSWAIRRTASKSPGDAAGNPASMTSTLRRASWRATSSFSAAVRPAPGACSPSRRVVSKMRTCPGPTNGPAGRGTPLLIARLPAWSPPPGPGRPAPRPG